MTMTAAPDTGRDYNNPLRIPSKSSIYEQRDTKAMRWADLSPLVTFPGERWAVHIDRDGACWRMVPDDDVDLYRIREYLRHGFGIIDRAHDKTRKPARNGLVPKSAVLEPVSHEAVRDHIVVLCMADAEQRLGTAGQPRHAKPTTKDWTVSRLRSYLAENDVKAQAVDGRLLLAWPEGIGPFTVDLRHALAELGVLLAADISGQPVGCKAVAWCVEKADVMLFVDVPACARHAEMNVQPKVEVTPTEWWGVLHLGAPRP